jgi:molybdenum cofactor guanylyltransferase
VPDDRIDGCTGVLVAGGRAARLGGFPKGLLRVGGEPIAARTLRLFGNLFPAALVIANDPAPYRELGAAIAPDRIPGKGAPGGVHAALRTAATDWIFAAACDMHFLEAGPIRLLAAHRRPGVAAVLVRFGGRLHPLHAFWSRDCLPALEAMLAAGDPSLVELACAVPAHLVEEEEWRTVDPAGRALENANTPGDAARLGLGRQS